MTGKGLFFALMGGYKGKTGLRLGITEHFGYNLIIMSKIDER
jgi:hypothetical protein